MDMVALLAAGAKVAVVVGALQGIFAVMVWVERRGSAIIQLRRGPNRVGPFGLLQPLADGLKFIFKEDIVSPVVHRPTYILAPAIAVIAAFLGFAVIPFGGVLTIGEHQIPLVIADIDAGVLLLLATSSLGVYAVILAGWASNNKYSQFGGLRASSQMISYELALGFSVIAVAVMAGSLRPIEIVARQAEGGLAFGALPGWYVFYNPLGFFLLLIGIFAETNRLPFDLPEAETELVGGYHTEYSSMKFAMFFMGEYVAMITGAALLVTLYFGGYAVPESIRAALGLEGNLLVAAQVATFMAKLVVFLWLYIWVRWTLPRFRFDQLLKLGWKVLVPLGLINVLWAGILVVMGWV